MRCVGAVRVSSWTVFSVSFFIDFFEKFFLLSLEVFFLFSFFSRLRLSAFQDLDFSSQSRTRASGCSECSVAQIDLIV